MATNEDLQVSEPEYDDGTTYQHIPSYMVAADNHQTANGDFSLLNVAKDVAGAGAGAYAGMLVGQTAIPIPGVGTAIGAGLGAVVGGIVGYKTADSDGKFAQASLLSGANSFYNSGAAISNFFGSDAEQRDTEAWIRSRDNDLGQYYADNKEATDLTGFMLGSILPSGAALKAYNLTSKALLGARAGVIGANMSAGTGLLMDAHELALGAAMKDITSATSTFSMLNRNLIKAYALGTGEAMLQSAVMETFTAATLFKSPILEDMDVGDLASNILWGTAFGGAFQGGVTALQSYRKVATARIASDELLSPYTFRTQTAEGVHASDKMLVNASDKFNTPGVTPELEQQYGVRPATLRTTKLNALDQDIRVNTHALASDTVVSNLVADNLVGIGDMHTFADSVMGLRELGRLAQPLKAELANNRLTRKIAAGTATEEEFAQFSSHSVVHLNTWGEGAGQVIHEAPAATAIQDMVKSGQKIAIDAAGITIGSANKIKFDAALKKSFDPFIATSVEAQARQLWAQSAPINFSKVTVGELDTAVLKRAYLELTNGTVPIVQVRAEDGSVQALDAMGVLNRIEDSTRSLKLRMRSTDPTKPLTNEELALRLDVKLAYLEGTSIGPNKVEDLFANMSNAQAYIRRIGNTSSKEFKDWRDVTLLPKTLKLAYDTSIGRELNRNVTDAMAHIAQVQKLQGEKAEKAVASVLREHANKLPRLPAELILKANSFGAGAGGVTFPTGEHGTLSQAVEWIGKATNLIRTERVNAVKDRLNPLLVSLAGKPEAAVHFSAVQNIARGTPEAYILNETGDALILRGLADEQAARAAATTQKELDAIKPYTRIDPSAAETIDLKYPEVKRLVSEHIAINASAIKDRTTLRNANGLQDRLDGRVFYAPPVNPKDYPHIAFVVDDTVTGTGHVRMLHAADEHKLGEMKSQVLKHNPELTVITKGESERYHKAYGDYVADSGLNENYLDVALHRSGVSASYLPQTDATKIANDLLKWHVQRQSQIVREAINTKYEREFAELARLGEQYTDLATSKYGKLSMLKTAEDTVNNPYIAYIKTALDLPPSSSNSAWATINRTLDRKVSEVWNRMTETMVNTKTPQELVAVNEVLQNAGIKTATYDATVDLLANHDIPKGIATAFAQKMNALTATLTLAPDVLQAVNNVVGSIILTAPELRSLTSAIASGSAEGAGDLASLAMVKFMGKDQHIFSPTKLFSNSTKRWFDPEVRKWHEAAGFTTRRQAEVQSSLETLALDNIESTASMNQKIAAGYNKIMKFGELANKYSGNSLAEEFARFIAADATKQITDVAVKHGIIEPAQAYSYINTVVNRTQGNYLASQRPMMFSGPVGQAIGLFQTYQLNLMQQLFRRVGNGDAKMAAMMLGLQGSIYGMNGLPLFQAINKHLIGTAAGNPTHQDAYSATYSLADKEAGDWLMYGAASNMLGLFHPDLKMNLYTRGDVNPRHITIIPTSIADIPFVSISSKFFGNLVDTGSKLLRGGAVGTTILQGIEHNGVSRPLAGLAQSLEAFTNPALRSFSTTSGGSLSATNDLFTLANASRILGAKPMDESIASDLIYRKTAYQATDAARRKSLGAAISSTVVAGKHPSEEQMRTFAEQYAKAGGNQRNFIRFYMDIYKRANVSQANTIRKELSSPYHSTMQRILGGYSFRDFSNDPIASEE